MSDFFSYEDSEEVEQAVAQLTERLGTGEDSIEAQLQEAENLLRETASKVQEIESNPTTTGGDKLQPFILDFYRELAHNSVNEIEVEITQIDSKTTFIPDKEGIAVEVVTIKRHSVVLRVTTTSTLGSFSIIVSNGANSNQIGGSISLDVLDLIIIVPENWDSATSGVEAGVGYIKATSTSSGWNKSGVFGTLPANTDGELRARFAGNVNGQTAYIMFGLDSNPEQSTSYNSIDYCIYLTNGSNYYCYESGRNKGRLTNVSAKVGDEFRLVREGARLKYYINDILVREVDCKTDALSFDCSIYRGAYLDNISIRY